MNVANSIKLILPQKKKLKTFVSPKNRVNRGFLVRPGVTINITTERQFPYGIAFDYPDLKLIIYPSGNIANKVIHRPIFKLSCQTSFGKLIFEKNKSRTFRRFAALPPTPIISERCGIKTGVVPVNDYCEGA